MNILNVEAIGVSKKEHVVYMNLFADMVSQLKGEEYKKAIAASAKIAWESALQSVRISAAEMELVLGKSAVAGGSAVAEGVAALREATDAYTAIEAPSGEAAAAQQKVALQTVAHICWRIARLGCHRDGRV